MNLFHNLKPYKITYRPFYKTYIKIIRTNRYSRVIKVNKQNKKWLSLQFRKDEKMWMIIPYTSKCYKIQIHIDKHYKLVKFMKVRINLRTNGRQHL